MKSVRIGGRLNVVAASGGQIWTGAFLHEDLDAVDPATREASAPAAARTIGVGVNGLAASGDDAVGGAGP